jgi:hypothetical protein
MGLNKLLAVVYQTLDFYDSNKSSATSLPTKLRSRRLALVATGSSTNLQKRKLPAWGLHSAGNVYSVTPR